MAHDQNEPTFQASAGQGAAVSAPAEQPDKQSSSSSFGEHTATAVAAEAPPTAAPPTQQEGIEASPEPGSTPMPQAQAQTGAETETAANSVTESTEQSNSQPTAQAEAQPTNGEAETSEGMEQLIEQYATPPAAPAEGEIFDGRVIAVNDTGVVVDVGGKFEGLVPAQEFLETGGAIPFGPGQTIEVERLHEHKDGYVLLSHVRAHRRRIWENVEKSYREAKTITGKVIERIKGGLVVDIGVRAFLPASQIELRPVHDLEVWKDREIELRVLKLNRKRGNVVVSRRVLLEDAAKTQAGCAGGIALRRRSRQRQSEKCHGLRRFR